MYNSDFSLNNIRTDSEIHKFIKSEFRNYRLRLEWPLYTYFLFLFTYYLLPGIYYFLTGRYLLLVLLRTYCL